MHIEMGESPRVVVIGGGTGSFTLLSQLKHYVADLTALVNMVDDGGSTGLLRDDLGVLPPGDIRQCLVALSNSSPQLRELFTFRFPEGGLAGHSFGNLFLSAVEKMTGNFDEAVDLASQVLNIHGKVLPMTLDDCRLIMTVNGKEIVGESSVSLHPLENGDRPRMSLRPKAVINPRARAAIEAADMVVIAPGGIYNSLIPALAIDGVAEAIKTSKAKVVYVCNLVNKGHQANDFSVDDYVQELEKYIGKGMISHVLYNTQEPNEWSKEAYAAEGQTLVGNDVKQFNGATYQPVPGNFLSKQALPKSENTDAVFNNVQRNLIRHDANAVCKTLMRIYFN